MLDRFASYAARLCLTAEGIARRGASIDRQRRVVQSVWPKAFCYPIGSYPTKTSLKNSDVDLLVSIPGQSEERKSLIRAATAMKEAVIGKCIAKPYNCTVIEGARVPILTYMDENEVPPLKFDISFQKENAVRNTSYLIEKFDERPFMRDLVIVIKHWYGLREKQLNEVYRGGLGSYAVALTVIGFFNVQRRKLDEKQYHAFITGSTYDMFVEYLEFWTKWKYKEYTMIPDPGEILTKKKRGKKGLGFMLRIMDPTDPENDVGRASHKVSRVFTAMVKLKGKIRRFGPDMNMGQLDYFLSATPAERKLFLKEKADQDRNNMKLHLKLQMRIRKAENKTSKAAQRSLTMMLEKQEEFLARRPTFAAQVAKAEHLLKDSDSPEQDLVSERGLNHDMPTIVPDKEEMQPQAAPEFDAATLENSEELVLLDDDEEEVKSPEQEKMEREAKHAATIAKKREKRQKLFQRRRERKEKTKEMKVQKRIKEAEKKELKKQEESAKMALKAGKKAKTREKEARNGWELELYR
ncbi:hypothetical protein L873DRAFT_1675502 [Choiromyces venosus 120613-1]|uniref:Poly(A) RNA polymerase mitochondrial-like central palm domain-containing protein n=1 Tax=Choiromyces venosus 120613-1 TaxID=1336337 RepID=A0A3N4JXX0_9PEZI|nr:hypothetical protein L873DRAFT_1675502 [Choiromyces venosus 120613-1]